MTIFKKYDFYRLKEKYNGIFYFFYFGGLEQ